MKTQLKYKVFKQSAEMGGKLYGVINNSDPVNSELTMQQIIESKKLYGYTAKGLSVLVEEVLQGAADLVARDGRPRNLSSLLKFEARIKGAFDSTAAGITTQDIFVRPRMLKDIKATLDKASFTFVNETAGDSPRIVGLALDSADFIGWNANSIWKLGGGFIGDLTVSGDRLLLDGQTPNDIKVSLGVIRGEDIYRFDHASEIFDSGNESSGFLVTTPKVASANTLVFESKEISTFTDNTLSAVWKASTLDPLANKADVATGIASYTPAVGDKLVLTIARPLAEGVGYATATKEVTLA